MAGRSGGGAVTLQEALEPTTLAPTRKARVLSATAPNSVHRRPAVRSPRSGLTTPADPSAATAIHQSGGWGPLSGVVARQRR